jgi:formate hydrogenlyase subunit 3/multisubunit Na+/H+ antiporter MnhD subunit
MLLVEWKPVTLFPASPSLLVDHASWPFLFALVSLTLAIILTAAASLQSNYWMTWSNTLLLAGLGILAVISGNLLTLLLAWAVIRPGRVGDFAGTGE